MFYVSKDGPITKEASPMSAVRRPRESHGPKMEKSQVYVDSSDHEKRWKATGVLGLSDRGLKVRWMHIIYYPSLINFSFNV